MDMSKLPSPPIKEFLNTYHRYTPDYIFHLKPNQIFVFGTDLRGSQKYGAAGIANRLFGAKAGVSEGLTGQTYAIPTKGNSYEMLYESIHRFISYAKEHCIFTYLVTPIGCGYAGFNIDVIAPIFLTALFAPNIYLPKRFIEYYSSNLDKIGIKSNISQPSTILTHYNSSNDDCNETLRQIRDLLNNKGIKYNFEGGFLLIDEDGLVIGEAELGVETMKLVVNPFNSLSMKAFTNAGYSVLSIKEAIQTINNV